MLSRFDERIIAQIPTDVSCDDLSVDTCGGHEIRRETLRHCDGLVWQWRGKR